MKIIICVALLTLALIGHPRAVSYIATEQLTIDNTAGGVGFTAAKITPSGLPQATTAVCKLETAQVRYQINGPPSSAPTAPTTTLGTPWDVGETRTFNGHDILVNFRAIRTGASSGVANCDYSAP